MTVARINFGGRLKVPASAVAVQVATATSPPTVSASYNLEGLDLTEHADATVALEASVQSRIMRFPAGTVGAPMPISNQELSEFADCQGLVFRLKIVDQNTHRLVASADRINPEIAESDGSSESLLPVRSSHDLGQIPWKLDLSDDRPALVVNADLGDKDSVVSSQNFQSLVFPYVIQQIAMWVIELQPDVDDSDEAAAWLDFLDGAGSDSEDLPSEDATMEERLEWADRAVQGFSQSHALVNALVAEENGGAK